MRDLVLCYLVWSGMVATLTAPNWAVVRGRWRDWRVRFSVLVWLWLIAGLWFPLCVVWGAALGLLDAIRGRS